MFTFIHYRQRLKRHECACRETASETRHQPLGRARTRKSSLNCASKRTASSVEQQSLVISRGHARPIICCVRPARRRQYSRHHLGLGNLSWNDRRAQSLLAVSPIAFGNGADASGCLSRAMRSMPCARLDIFLYIRPRIFFWCRPGSEWRWLFQVPHGRRSTRATLPARRKRAIHGDWLPASSALSWP
jgi:hypothetical protein